MELEEEQDTFAGEGTGGKSKMVKKIIQRYETVEDEEESKGHGSEKDKRTSSQKKVLPRTMSKPFYDPDAAAQGAARGEGGRAGEEAPHPSSFLKRLSGIFHPSSRRVLSQKTIAIASNTLSKTAQFSSMVPQKMREVIAATDLHSASSTSASGHASGSSSGRGSSSGSIDVIGSEHCIFNVAILWHLSRQLLVIKGMELEVSKGARVKALLRSSQFSSLLVSSASTSTSASAGATSGDANSLLVQKLQNSYATLKKSCQALTPCPSSLQELSETSSFLSPSPSPSSPHLSATAGTGMTESSSSRCCTRKDLKHIFQSQLKISNHLFYEETFISKHFTKLDSFLNLILTIPCYSRLALEDSTPHELNLMTEGGRGGTRGAGVGAGAGGGVGAGGAGGGEEHDEALRNILLATNVTKDPLAEMIEIEYRARRTTKFDKKTRDLYKTKAPTVVPLLNPSGDATSGLNGGSSGGATSGMSCPHIHPLGLPSGAHIGLNGYGTQGPGPGGGSSGSRDGRRLWSAYLDPTIKGMESYFAQHLLRNEAILQWNLFTSSPSHGSSSNSSYGSSYATQGGTGGGTGAASLGSNSHPLQCTLIWKDMIQDVPPYIPSHLSSQTAKHITETLTNRAVYAAKQFADKRQEYLRNIASGRSNINPFPSITEFFSIDEVEKVFMECCCSDVDLTQIHFALTSFLDSLHSRPAPIRSSKLTSALSLLSDCFALNELLSKLPPHIDTLVFCFSSSYLSLVPWSLLLIQDTGPNQAATGTGKGRDPLGRFHNRTNLFEQDEGLGQGLGLGQGQGQEEESKVMHVIDHYAVRIGSSLSMMEMNSTHASTLSQAPGMHKLCYIDGDDQAILPLTDVETMCVANLWSGDHWDFNVLQGIWASVDSVSTKFSEKSLEEQAKETMEKKIRREKMRVAQQRVKAQQKAKAQSKRQGYSRRQRQEGDGEEEDQESEEGEDEEESSSSEEEDEEEKEDKHTRFRNSKSISNCRVLHLSGIWDPDSTAFISGGAGIGSGKKSISRSLPLLCLCNRPPPSSLSHSLCVSTSVSCDCSA
jgi:hypothetical protein